MARPIARGVLSFGLVAIPVEIHSAVKDQTVRFHLLHAVCGARVRNQFVCPVCNKTVERGELVRGYEIAKGQYIQVTDAELESLEAEANNNIELREFIPMEKIDPVFFERSYYLAPAAGGEKAYRLLADAMAEVGRGALAEMVSHDKEKLVLIRSAQRGLIMQQMYYANEVRDFGAIGKGNGARLTPEEFELATGLIEKLSNPEFEPENYSDLYRAQVLAMIEGKSQGREITVPPRAPARGQVIDILAALKQSLDKAKPQPKAERGGRKKARGASS